MRLYRQQLLPVREALGLLKHLVGAGLAIPYRHCTLHSALPVLLKHGQCVTRAFEAWR
jgi:hypothetical protein